MSIPLLLHGHFYQPPRENPWTEIIDPEPTAAPYPDWNERIHAECYRANAFARIFDAHQRVEAIRNNYRDLSFDFGPTLLSWMERKHPRTYARILAADWESRARHGGHGNALAHGYNHAILPLCNDRDRRTQIRWGMADFRFRFGRAPEGFWLPETAADPAALGDLIDAGIAFVILSPHQAARVKEDGASTWRDVTGGKIETGRPYRFLHPDGSGRSIAIFFYDGEFARAIAFDGGLASSQVLVEHVRRAAERTSGLVHAATDGETYGHHGKFGDLALAYALESSLGSHGFRMVNYGEYLEAHPPSATVELELGEDGRGSSWSCSHGVARWFRSCGCAAGDHGGHEDWRQEWRGPLREALDLLRDHAAAVFESSASALLTDPWAARDEYIWVLLSRNAQARRADSDPLVEADGGEWTDASGSAALEALEGSVEFGPDPFLILDRGAIVSTPEGGGGLVPFRPRLVSVDRFFQRHARRAPNRKERTHLLRLLEMQRHALLMYTSCGWFWEDLARGETVQVLRYAGRVIDLLEEMELPAPRSEFLDRLAAAQSNDPAKGNGADLFHTEVMKARVTPRRMVAQLGFARLAREEERPAGRFEVRRHRVRRGKVGDRSFVTGRVTLRCSATESESDLVYCAFHLGGIDVYCGVREHSEAYEAASRRVRMSFLETTLPGVLRVVEEEFGPIEFTPSDLLPGSLEPVGALVFSELVMRFREQYRHLYEENLHLIDPIQAIGFPLPVELRAAAEITLGRRFEAEVLRRRGSPDPNAYQKAVAIAEEMDRRGFRIRSRRASRLLGLIVEQSVRAAVAGGDAKSNAGPDAVDAANAAGAEDGGDSVKSVREVGGGERAVSAAVALLELVQRLGVAVRLERTQELVYDTIMADPAARARLAPLGKLLNLSPQLFETDAT